MTENTEVSEILSEWLDQKFTKLYRDLCGLYPHPFDWQFLLFVPKWWQFKRKHEYRRVAMCFASNGILLTDDMAQKFDEACRRYPQRFDEDCGGSVVRNLRAVFGYAFIGPFVGLMDVDQ